MVKELHGAQLGPPEATIAADAKKKSASSSRQGSPSKKNNAANERFDSVDDGDREGMRRMTNRIERRLTE